ncbi:sporulation protein [Anaerostipes sp.]|uniref:sporulation protein n=1 Tax=Anaerostipes sp. TaxID=1872530 RepID=UPI0025C4F70C|nr:sporulation protein [Anaerostipes sp.]MBS7008219.1 sporulation protein [Anaerostipes sp.]
MGKYFYQFCLILTAFLLFLFPEQCVAGAKNGLLLWSGTIVPTLLPFFLLTNLMMKYQTVHYISYLFYPLFKIFPRLNKDLAYTILMGFLCGYPLGGKIINDLVLSGSYTKKEGEALLVLCNNVSPMFSIGFTLTLILKGSLSVPLYFCCLYIPNLLYFIFILFKNKGTGFLHIHQEKPMTAVIKSFDDIVFDSLKTIFTIGIFIMVFSIVSALLQSGILPDAVSSPVIGMLEITTGISHVSLLALNFRQKAAAILAVSSFGGLCSMAQVKSVCQKSQLSMKSYLIFKMIFAVISSGMLLFLL